MIRKNILKKIKTEDIINLGNNTYSYSEYIIDIGKHKIADKDMIKEMFADAILIHLLSIDRMKKEKINSENKLFKAIKLKKQNKEIDKKLQDILKNSNPKNISNLTAIDILDVDKDDLYMIDQLRKEAGLMEYSILQSMQKSGYIIMQYLDKEEKETLKRIKNIKEERKRIRKQEK